VDSGCGNSIYWTLPVVTTSIHVTTLQHINQRLCLLSSVFRTALPGRRNFTSVFLAPCWTLDSGTLLTLSVSASVCKSSQSQSYIATDGRSISKSWCRAPSGAHDHIFIIVWQLRSCFCGAPSVTRGRVCLLYMLLALASAVFLGSESLGSRDHILLSQLWDFPFRRLLRLTGSRWRYSTPPPHGFVCKFSQPSP
jgi:hypothetical protein